MKIGLIGWRSMVGSVLLKRMAAENDFSRFKLCFFSTSQMGEALPNAIKKISHDDQQHFYDANDLKKLKEMDIVLTCQGSDWTKKIYPALKKEEWQGYWIDAASHLRMKDESVIVLDPINQDLIRESLENGKKTFCGGNCTTSILLMGIGGLLKENLVESISFMSYQSASGAGKPHMEELMAQMDIVAQQYKSLKIEAEIEAEKNDALTTKIDAFHESQTLNASSKLNDMLKKDAFSKGFPKDKFGHPLALNILPWIDADLENGQSKEEEKTQREANKILGKSDDQRVLIDGICVRVPVMQCHSEALTITLKKEIGKEITMKEIKEIIQSTNEYVKIIDNTKEATLKNLNPIAVMNTLNVHVGRIRKMTTNPRQMCAFIVGDQLMWGAAEPLRRILNIIINFQNKKK